MRQQVLLKKIEPATEESMKKAASEEARMAIEAGDVSKDGIPVITVIVDASWLKRSFGRQYDSLSSLGVIIGARTGKVLDMELKINFAIVVAKQKIKIYVQGNMIATETFLGSDLSP